MKLPTVEKFLLCMSLEAGGYVIGGITAVFAGVFSILFIMTILLSIGMLFGASSKMTQDQRAFLIFSTVGKSKKNKYFSETLQLTFKFPCLQLYLSSRSTWFSSSLALFSWFVESKMWVHEQHQIIILKIIIRSFQRNYRLCKLQMILMAIGVIVSIITIFTKTPIGVAAVAEGVVTAFIEFYFFICIYSLREMLKREGFGFSIWWRPVKLFCRKPIKIFVINRILYPFH